MRTRAVSPRGGAVPATILVVVLGLLAGCSPSEEGSPSTTAAAGESTIAAGDDSGTTDGAGFEVPPELLARVEESGFAFPEVDYPGQPDGVAWPTEEWERAELPEGVDAAEVQAIVDSAFAPAADPADTVDAILVVHGGQIVLEEYNGMDPEDRHNSWSVAKSITQSMVGILQNQGELDIFERARAEEWPDPADPRNAITLDQLLRMSSGLEWTEDYVDATGDVPTVLAAPDRAAYVASKPLEADPDTSWEYSTGTSDLIAREVAYRVGFGPEFEAWIQDNLFGPLGIPGADLDMDDTGVINGGSWINMRAEDFARFGLLYLRDGVWDGERLLPEGWVDYSRMPTPTSESREYGAQWWLMEDPELPEVFMASGYNGQSITVMPEQDVVIVILSTSPSERDVEVQERLMDAFSGVRPPGTVPG